jgi:hypothetical protein
VDVELEMLGLVAGVGAALLFPILAVVVHARRDRRRNRKNGMRRTDKISL